MQIMAKKKVGRAKPMSGKAGFTRKKRRYEEGGKLDNKKK